MRDLSTKIGFSVDKSALGGFARSGRMLMRTMARTLEMANGAEALFELKGLNKTQDDQQHRDDDQYVCAGKALQRADERDDCAHHGNHKQPQRIELSLKDKRFKAFALGRFFIHKFRRSSPTGLRPQQVRTYPYYSRASKKTL